MYNLLSNLRTNARLFPCLNFDSFTCWLKPAAAQWYVVACWLKPADTQTNHCDIGTSLWLELGDFLSKSARDIHLACESSLSKLLSRWDDLRAVDVRGWILAAALSRGDELCAWKLVEHGAPMHEVVMACVAGTYSSASCRSVLNRLRVVVVRYWKGLLRLKRDPSVLSTQAYEEAAGCVDDRVVDEREREDCAAQQETLGWSWFRIRPLWVFTC